MLIGDSISKLICIRFAIVSLRLIAPASIVYCLLFPLCLPKRRFFQAPFPLPLSLWAASESAFFLFAYLPLRVGLQKQVRHPEPPTSPERQQLFTRCLESVLDLEAYASGWFLGSPLSCIKRDNLKEFYTWSFMNKKYKFVDEYEDEELDEYVQRLERAMGQEFEPGYGNARSLRTTIESVYVQHRPLLWYSLVGFVDCLTSAILIYHGFRCRRQSLLLSIATLPVRPHTIFSPPSPSKKISYWYREHTSKDKLPVLFIHGIGVGLHTYTDFLVDINPRSEVRDEDGVIGIIAMEILPISSRICTPALAGDEMRDEIRQIIDSHGWQEFVLVGHSYGSAVAATILRDTDFRARVKAAVLMDPICFLLHLPDVAYNFTRRKPSTASQYMLYYFSSQDIMISHTLARRFFWSQYILWKEGVAGVPLTVSLSGQDIVVPTKAVWKYLTQSSSDINGSLPLSEGPSESITDDTVEWQGDSHKVIWFDQFNHADLFASKGATRRLAKVVRDYCAAYGKVASNDVAALG